MNSKVYKKVVRELKEAVLLSGNLSVSDFGGKIANIIFDYEGCFNDYSADLTGSRYAKDILDYPEFDEIATLATDLEVPMPPQYEKKLFAELVNKINMLPDYCKSE